MMSKQSSIICKDVIITRKKVALSTVILNIISMKSCYGYAYCHLVTVWELVM